MESRHIVVLRRGQFCTRLRFSRILTQRLIRTPCRRKRRDWDSCWSDWFDVLDAENRPVLTEREILRNLQAIVTDADQMPIHEVCELASFVSHLAYVLQVARNAIGVLSTENRKIWSSLRKALISNRNNESCLEVVDNALFVVCLDDAAPENLAQLCDNFLCGTYDLKGGIQIGTCTNRWYDKVCTQDA